MKNSLNYSKAGVNYAPVDQIKQMAQEAAHRTNHLLQAFNFNEMPHIRGESAYVFDMGPFLGAVVSEGLGTKNLIADAMVEINPNQTRKYYKTIGWDTVATIVNDIITVGAEPVIVGPHWAAGDSSWFENKKRATGLIEGWRRACVETGATYGPGETSILKDVVRENTIDLSGFGFGIVNPKEHLILGRDLAHGDKIVIIESSGIHANGITLARQVADKRLAEGYKTKLPSGRTYGEALLTPTNIYVQLQKKLLKENIGIHYMVNITGHGWRKLMRAKNDFTYRVSSLPEIQEEFSLIQERAKLSDYEMYETFNMGGGFAFMTDPHYAKQVQDIATSLGYKSWDVGVVEKGEKQVIIEPKNIVFSRETLSIR